MERLRRGWGAMIVAGAMGVASVPGCIAISGGSELKSPTLGQQLMDLKAAQDRGAITPAEYERKKAQLLAN